MQELATRNAELEQQLARQREENAQQREEIAELKALVVELREELNRHSGNSSKPPSRDSPSQRAKNRQKHKRRAPRTLTEREQRLLLKVTGEHRVGFRDHVLYAMALGTGLREHELVALDVGDVFDLHGRARRRIVLRVFKGCDRTSGGQDVLVPEGLWNEK